MCRCELHPSCTRQATVAVPVRAPGWHEPVVLWACAGHAAALTRGLSVLGGEAEQPVARTLTARVLEELAHQEATAAALARQLDVPRSTLAATLTQLLARGLVARATSRPATYALAERVAAQEAA